MAMEIKGPKTPFTPCIIRGVKVHRQREYAEDRSVLVFRSLDAEEALEMVYAFQQSLSLPAPSSGGLRRLSYPVSG